MRASRSNRLSHTRAATSSRSWDVHSLLETEPFFRTHHAEIRARAAVGAGKVASNAVVLNTVPNARRQLQGIPPTKHPRFVRLRSGTPNRIVQRGAVAVLDVAP